MVMEKAEKDCEIIFISGSQWFSTSVMLCVAQTILAIKYQEKKHFLLHVAVYVLDNADSCE